MADIEALKLTGEGVIPERLSDFEEQFEQARQALTASRDNFFGVIGTYLGSLDALIRGRVLRVVDLDENAFSYYAGREVVTSWMGEVTRVGPKEYYYADHAKLVGAEVLGLSVEGPSSEGSGYASDPRGVKLDSLHYIETLRPVLKFGFEGDEYSGPLRSAVIEVAGTADDAFVRAHTPAKLEEIHSY